MRRPALPLLVVFAALLAGSGGCATGAGATSSSGGSATVISRDQLEPLAHLSAYDAVQRLRPTWLRARGSEGPPVIILDGSPMGGPDVLRTIQAESVARMVYVNGRDATTRYGTGYGGGAIEVTTR